MTHWTTVGKILPNKELLLAVAEFSVNCWYQYGIKYLILPKALGIHSIEMFKHKLLVAMDVATSSE